MNEKKECKILGFKPYEEKDENKKLTGNRMLRIFITIEPNDSEYYGEVAIPVFLPYNEEFERDLKKAYDHNLTCEYKTTDNIITGKTKVTSIIVD